MARRVLTSTHAEDVGGVIVEPGEELPEGADPDVVKRLDAEGKLGKGKAETEKKGAS